MRTIRLHDTRKGELVELRPRDEGRVGIYACGPTVYSRIHIGNARPYVVFSLLKRFLANEGYETTLVVNVTDVNDKIYEAAKPDPDSPDPARRAGRPSAELATEMTERYVADTDGLGLGRPDHEPLASGTMDAIVGYIADLIAADHAYAAGGDVYFRVRSDPGYGSLSHRRLEEMDQGEGGGENGPPDAERDTALKQDHLDFALWKAHKPGEDTQWDPRDYIDATPSNWHSGRPGWHIECSAMAESLLGVGFDIHGGGSDLVFPHHENEAAQTRAARGQELAKIWMHNGMIQLTGEKMAKSAGNIAPLYDVLERHGRDAVVMYLASGHYRQPLAFSEAELREAGRRVYRIRDALRRLDAGAASPSEMAGHRDAFFGALAEDFNTPKALASLFEWIREANRRGVGVGDADLREMLGVLGFDGLSPLQSASEGSWIAPEATALLARREQARAERDYETADRLRDELRALGFEIRDGQAGAELIPVSGSDADGS